MLNLFESLFDFCHRLDARKVNRRVLEPLVRSGALDNFGVSRASLFASTDKAIKAAEQRHRNAELGQNDLFGGGAEVNDDAYERQYVEADEWSDTERLRGEKETLGLYITGHPLKSCEAELTALKTVPINKLQLSGKTAIIIAGVIVSVRTIITKSGKKMAVMSVEDRTGRLDVTLFSDLYHQVFHELENDSIFIIKGPISKDDYTGGIKMVAETVMSLDNVREKMAKRLLIQVSDSGEVDQLLAALPDVIQPYAGGRCSVTIAYQGQEAGAELVLGDNWRVKPNTELLLQLSRLCGQDRVVLEY